MEQSDILSDEAETKLIQLQKQEAEKDVSKTGLALNAVQCSEDKCSVLGVQTRSYDSLIASGKNIIIDPKRGAAPKAPPTWLAKKSSPEAFRWCSDLSTGLNTPNSEDLFCEY